jgi:hypothetical protein
LIDDESDDTTSSSFSLVMQDASNTITIYPKKITHSLNVTTYKA